MKVLALTHAHLHPDGLSPVSCERADSIVGAWAERLNWDVDVVYTSGTKWRGIWPEGQGLKVNISIQDAPQELRMGAADLFSTTLQTLINKRQFASAASLVNKRVGKRLRKLISKAGFALPHDLMIAKKWGLFLSRADDIKSQRFDFVFVCVIIAIIKFGMFDRRIVTQLLAVSHFFNIPADTTGGNNNISILEDHIHKFLLRPVFFSTVAKTVVDHPNSGH